MCCLAGEAKATDTLSLPKHVRLDQACTALAHQHFNDPAISEPAKALLQQIRAEPGCSRFGSQLPNTLDQIAGQMVLDVDKLHFVVLSNYVQTAILTNLTSAVVQRLHDEPPSAELAAVLRSYQSSKHLSISGPYNISSPGVLQKHMRLVSLLGRKAVEQRQMFPETAPASSQRHSRMPSSDSNGEHNSRGDDADSTPNSVNGH